MLPESLQSIVKQYLAAVRAAGVHARRAVVFGSHARGTADHWSDIDLVVIAPELDHPAGQ